MNNRLMQIIAEKQKTIAALKQTYQQVDVAELKKRAHAKSFKSAIDQQQLCIIGEIKRRSPSKGDLATLKDPLTTVDQYLTGGVSAISVLTEPSHFAGSMADLQQVVSHLKHCNVPVLRKDFIVDKIQIIESIMAGANAILLIVSVLKDNTERLLNDAKQLGIDAIVEVHNERELQLAIDIGAEIIGINNRDLHTFEQNIEVCLQLAPLVPKHIISIAESAIKTPADIQRIRAAGFNAALIGEALVTSDSPSTTLKKMLGTL